MKFLHGFVMIIGLIAGLAAAEDHPDTYYCNTKEYKKSKEYKKMAAAFYKELMNKRPSMVNLLMVIRDQDLKPEKFIGIVDKDYKCNLTHNDFVQFLEKWAKKKHQKLSEKSRRFIDVAFNYIDDNKDGNVNGSEMSYAITVIAQDYKELGDNAEDMYAFVG